MKRFLLLLSIFLMSLMASAQFVVTSFEHDEGDMKARVDAKQDRNGQYCALLKISTVGINETARQKFNFGGDMGTQIVDVSFPTGAIWVYLSPGRPTLMIKHPDLGNVMYDVPIELKPKCTYKMRIEMETATLVIKAVPAEADIYINGELVGKGYASKTVSIGAENRYKVSCDNYYPKEDVVKFEKTRTEERTVELEPNFGYITIKSEPSGADIYVDEQKVGTTPYLMKKIKLGSHVVELRMTGYETFADMVTIKAGEPNKQLENVKLTAIRIPMGSMELTSNPTGAIITINGRQYGQTPKTLTDFEVGTYTVYFSKEGYQNLSQTVEIKDGKKETLAVTMTKTTVPQPPVATTTTTPTTTTTAGNRTFTVNGVSFEMVEVKGGTFTMGCTSEQGGDCDSDEKPTHSVTLSDYYIGKFEVTQELWQAVMGTTVKQQRDKANTSWPMRGEGNNYPMYYISWNECQEFVRKLNQMTGQNFRLPTEAEWEYAARGGSRSNGYKYSGSNSIDNVAWYDSNSGKNTHQVGTKSPNELGIYDMTGNVWEWCQDWYGNYSSGSQTNPTGPSSGSRRVNRGGSWYGNAEYCRVSLRSYNSPGNRGSHLGFRLVLVR